MGFFHYVFLHLFEAVVLVFQLPFKLFDCTCEQLCNMSELSGLGFFFLYFCPKSGQGPTGQLFTSTCKLTLELKFRAQALDSLNRSLINEDEGLLSTVKWMLCACTVSGELDFSVVCLKRSVQVHVAFSPL